MKLNKIFTLLTLVCCINSINSMQTAGNEKILTLNNQPILLTQPLKEVQGAVKSRKLGAFFTCLESQQKDWLKLNKEVIRAIIEQDRLFMLGIDPEMKDIVELSETQKEWCKIHKTMNDGIDCAIQNAKS